MQNHPEQGDSIDAFTELRNALNIAASALATIANECKRNGNDYLHEFAHSAFIEARNSALPTNQRKN